MLTNTFRIISGPFSVLLTQTNAVPYQLVPRLTPGSASCVQNLATTTRMFDKVTILGWSQLRTCDYFAESILIGFVSGFADACTRVHCWNVCGNVVGIGTVSALVQTIPERTIGTRVTSFPKSRTEKSGLANARVVPCGTTATRGVRVATFGRFSIEESFIVHA